MSGQIVIDPENSQWLKRHGGRHVFVCGPGDPEDFLYRGARNSDGTRSGDQVELIEKLAQYGGNSIYMQAVRTHGGDARDDHTHNPFVDSDPIKGLDERILSQWEQWFALMDRHEILIYFLFYDDGALIWDTGDHVETAEREFFERIVRRFKHHKNLIWLVGEESEERYSHARVQALAEIIRQADDHGHPIGNHHLSGTAFKAWRPGGALNHFSMQLNKAGDQAHAGAIEARRHAAGRYQIIYAESTAAPTDPDGMRRHAWAVSMAGVMPMLLNMDIANTPPTLLGQCRSLQQFFEAADFHAMMPHDELRCAGTKYVLADPGRSYLAYADNASGVIGINGLPGGPCTVTWLDCQTGRIVSEKHSFTQPGDRSFDKPIQFGAECAAWIRFPETKAGEIFARSESGSTPTSSSRENQPPVVEDLRVRAGHGDKTYIQLQFTDADGPGPYSYTFLRSPQHGVLSGANNDLYYTPNPGFAGADEFTWKVNDGKTESRIATVAILVTTGAGAPREEGSYFPPPESQGGWRKLDTAEEVRRMGGMDPEKLAALRQWLLESDRRDFAAVVIRRGYIVLEVERGNSAKTDARRVASVSKAVCASVLAIASELSQQGRTPRRMTFDDPAFDFIPWAQPLSDPRKANIKVRQLFNHTSGICPEATGASNAGSWEYILGHSGDSRTARLAFDPGTGCGYSSHALCHASLVCENVTGLPYDKFAIKHLFEPIGCEHWWFEYFDGGERYGRHPSHGMGMPARDLARIAYCMLRGGQWAGRAVIPKWFVAETAAPTHRVTSPEMRWKLNPLVFSHGWELPALHSAESGRRAEHVPADSRCKPGSGGQLIAFVPSLDLVITRQTGGKGSWKYEEYLSRVCAAVIPQGGATETQP